MARGRGKPREKSKREADRAQVPKLYDEGYSLREIGAMFGVSCETIRKDMAIVYERWLEEGKKNFDNMIKRELLALDRIEVEAWSSWEKSLEDSVTYTQSDKDGNKEVRVGQSGNPRFLDIIAQNLQRRAKLLGYDKPEEIKVDSPVPAITINFTKD